MARPMPRFPPVTSTDLATFPSPHSTDCRPYGAAARTVSPALAGTANRAAPGGPQYRWSGVFEPEADLQPDLVVVDRVVDDVAADLGHLEPVQVPQRLPGPGDRVRDRRVDALLGGADDLGDAVGAIGHDSSPSPGCAATSVAAYRWC